MVTSKSTAVLSLPAIETLVAAEENADAVVLHLGAGENVLSPAARRVLGSPLGDRYLLEHLEMREKSPARLNNFLYRGLDRVNELEASATEVCRELFAADHADFRSLSGTNALHTIIAALTAPGDTVMRISTKCGGHFLTETVVRALGRESVTFAFDGFDLDIDRTRTILEEHRPSLLLVDPASHLFPLPVKELKALAPGVPLAYDASPTLGLIAGGQFPNPLTEGADILFGHTHGTFPGPPKGLILGRGRGLMERIGYTLSNGLVAGQHTAETLALFITLHEMHEHARAYAAAVTEAARHLAAALHERGVPVMASERGFTANHLVLVDTGTLGSGPTLLADLLRADVAVSRLIAFAHVDALRIGVQEVVRRGYTADDLDQVADWIADVLLRRRTPDAVRPEVNALTSRRPQILYCDPIRTGGEPRAATRRERTSPRWIDLELTREPLGPDDATTSAFAAARRLGALAAGFEHQSDSAGNVSCRVGDTTYVTASGAYIRSLTAGDFVELTGCTDWTLACRGEGPPSAEAYLHWLVPSAVPARFLVHNHYLPRDEELEGLDVLVVPPQEYGSVALAEAVAEAAPRSQVIYVRRHGLVVWSEDLATGERLLARAGGRRAGRPPAAGSGS